MDDSLFIPRRSIAAFASDPDVLGELEGLYNHVLLSRAQYNVFRGGIQEVINRYPVGGTPDLLIVEHNGDIEDLGRLAEVSSEFTQLILISQENDIGRYRKLIDQGGSDYLFTPISRERVLGAISRAFARAENKRTGKLVTFIGCGGGVGNSTMAQSVAVMLSKMENKKVLLCDFDIFTGTVALNFDIAPLRGVRELLKDPKSIRDQEISRITYERSSSLQILCSTPTFDPGMILRADTFIDILDQCRSLADYIIVDMPNGWGLLHNKILAVSERLILVTNPNLSSYQKLQNTLKQVGQLRKERHPLEIVMNRWNKLAEKHFPYDILEEAIQGAKVTKVGECPEHAIAATEKSVALAELTPYPEPLETLNAFATSLAGETDVATEVASKSLLKKLFGRQK